MSAPFLHISYGFWDHHQHDMKNKLERSSHLWSGTSKYTSVHSAFWAPSTFEVHFVVQKTTPNKKMLSICEVFLKFMWDFTSWSLCLFWSWPKKQVCQSWLCWHSGAHFVTGKNEFRKKCTNFLKALACSPIPPWSNSVLICAPRDS